VSGPARLGLVAALLYLAIASFANRAVLADPFALLPTPVSLLEDEKPRFALAYRADQGFVVGNVARVARAFVSDPWNLGETGLCAPLSQPFTLGEHMFGQGLLGALPYLATGDPIFTFNMVPILSTWISALAMYALAFYWTRSFWAAFLSGLLFALHPSRLNNPAHLFGFANAWSALALLAVHRLFTHERWRDAALLALFLCLQLLESFYPVLALTIVGGIYGLWLCATYATRLPRLAPKLLAVALFTGWFAWLILGPYLETQRTWGVLQGRNVMLLHPSRYLPGGAASPGWIALVLAFVGVLDRLRGARRRDDPRLPLLIAGFVLFWCSVWWIPVPGLGHLASPLLTLSGYVPGLGAVRALPALQFGVHLVVAILATYGVLALLERLPGTPRAVTAAVLTVAILVQTFYGPAAVVSFGAKADLEAFHGRPSDDELSLLERLPDGAVLDLPLDFEPMQKLRTMPGYLIDAGFHDRPVAACYNSFLTGLQADVQRLAQALPDRRAARALSALGFRSIRLHHRLAGPLPHRLERFLADPQYTELLGRAPDTSLYRLATHRITRDFGTIADGSLPVPASLDPPRDGILFRFRGRGPATFRHPDPIEPSAVRLRWKDASGELVGESSTRVLLPPALAPGDFVDRRLEVDVPDAPGLYVVELVRAARPDLVLSSRTIDVR